MAATRTPRTTPTTTLRAVAYLRVSTGEQADSGAGLQAQLESVTRAAESRGWELVAVHTDAGVSGDLPAASRPALTAALEQLDAGDADLLVVAKSDRLSRNTAEGVSLLDMAERARWELVIVDLGADLGTSNGRFMAELLAVFAAQERRLIRERTRAALAARKAAGVRLGRPVSLPAASRQRVAELRGSGLTLQQVADQLTSEQVPTARGGAWYPSTVAAVCRSLELDSQALAARSALVPA
jgi:DNA invertase Pin-like site-specific DNA recombinase